MATNTYTVDGYYVDAQGVYRAVHTVYTEEDAEQETEQNKEHREVEKEKHFNNAFDIEEDGGYIDNNIDTSNIHINSY